MTNNNNMTDLIRDLNCAYPWVNDLYTHRKDITSLVLLRDREYRIKKLEEFIQYIRDKTVTKGDDVYHLNENELIQYKKSMEHHIQSFRNNISMILCCIRYREKQIFKHQKDDGKVLHNLYFYNHYKNIISKYNGIKSMNL
jgi:hypothetical protein